MNLLIAEERSAVEFQLSPLRLANCNCHKTMFCSNVLLSVPSVGIAQLLVTDEEKALVCDGTEVQEYLSLKMH